MSDNFTIKCQQQICGEEIHFSSSDAFIDGTAQIYWEAGEDGQMQYGYNAPDKWPYYVKCKKCEKDIIIKPETDLYDQIDSNKVGGYIFYPE